LLLQRWVAVKVLPPEYAHDQQFLLRFKNEVTNSARLVHPHIVQVFDIGEAGDTAFFVMQLIAGRNLKTTLEQQGRLSMAETMRILRHIASALDTAHDLGIIHRDVKPENMLITHQGEAYLTDFGIARSIEGTRITGGLLGTPEYMSPEQCQGLDAGRQADQYSLAIVAYELLTGVTPFRSAATQPWALVNMHVTAPPPDPRQWVGDLPVSVCAALSRGLAKQPEERFASCSEFVEQLSNPQFIDATVSTSTLRTTTAAQTSPVSMQSPLPPRKGIWGFVSIVGLSILALFVAGMALNSNHFQHTPPTSVVIPPPVSTTTPTSTSQLPPISSAEPGSDQGKSSDVPQHTPPPQPVEENGPDYNVASGKPVQVSVHGNQADPGDGGDPQAITDGSLYYNEDNGMKARNGVIGWVNRTDGQTLKVTIHLNLQGKYRISQIRYNQGNVSRASSWNADYMITPFGKMSTDPGGEYRGTWSSQYGNKIVSAVDITLIKTKRSWDTDWLFVGEIEVLGHRYYGVK
jgi:serine/threonine-protein kinase